MQISEDDDEVPFSISSTINPLLSGIKPRICRVAALHNYNNNIMKTNEKERQRNEILYSRAARVQ